MRSCRSAVLGLVMALVVAASSALAAGASKPAPTGKVNINTAAVSQLTTLPGVGPKLAARIVEYRQKAGGFKSIQELMNVQGVGEKSFQKIQGYLSIADAASRSGSSR